MRRAVVAMFLSIGMFACAPATSKPQIQPVVPPPAAPPPGPPFEVKQASILRLEDRRILRDRQSADGPTEAIGSGAPSGAFVPDLIVLLTDDEARIRRRAALAIGRVGLPEGVEPLIGLLADRDAEVRQMAAFALGLIGDAAASAPLVAALADDAPLVKGSAAEALGLINAASAADSIASMASALLRGGAVTDSSLASVAEESRDTPTAAFRLALFSLVKLKAYPALASVVLDPSGQPLLKAWPVAFALQRLEDPRALPALRTLAADSDPTTRAFAVKGLGALKDRESVTPLIGLVGAADRASAIEAIRALGRISDHAAVPPLMKLVQAPKADPFLKAESVSALGLLGSADAYDTLLDVSIDPNPVVRANALRSLAQVNPAGFTTLLSGLDADPQFSVRSTLASVLGTLEAESVAPRLRQMLDDTDQRVIPSVIAAIAKLRLADAPKIAFERLKADDPVVRAAAASALGELKPPDGVAALADAYRRGQQDPTYVARTAALAALVEYGAEAARPLLTSALADKDWAARVRAAALLKQIDPASDAERRIAPAPTSLPADVYAAERLISPRFSTQAFIETDRGIIQLELAMIDAPLTVENFVGLANRGFFNGLTFHRVVPNFVVQAGDPRADSEGSPGYTIRDELSERAYVRGTVGMALDWEDTGGSQFFITHSPQPHLDDRYTVFGRVVQGMDVVDQIQQGDVIRQVKIWDGN